MNKGLAFPDYAVFIIYFIFVAGYGYFVYNKRKRNEHDAKGFFWRKAT